MHQTDVVGSIIEDSILDAASIHHDAYRHDEERSVRNTAKMANTAKASFFRNKSS